MAIYVSERHMPMKEVQPVMRSRQPAVVLTVAGSDSGGAAGLQADLKTFTALGVYGMSAVTAVTAQNSVRVEAVSELPASFLIAQMVAVLSDYGADAVKTGFVGRVELIASIARQIREYRLKNVVIDPVLVNHLGRRMFEPEVTRAYVTHLLPLADLLTPNRHEAALLANIPLPETMSLPWMRAAAERIHLFGPKNVLLKGGRHAADSLDLIFDGTKHMIFTSPWIDTENTHGAGDTLSAAVSAFLAQGKGMKEAVKMARIYTYHAIARAARWRLGSGHGPVSHGPAWPGADPFDLVG
jgi:hydroxymethylpyrimidine/phosphomethylpyrimidine kinase